METNQKDVLTYDDKGRVTSLTVPGGGVFTYTYDDINNEVTETWPSGKKTVFKQIKRDGVVVLKPLV